MYFGLTKGDYGCAQIGETAHMVFTDRHPSRANSRPDDNPNLMSPLDESRKDRRVERSISTSRVALIYRDEDFSGPLHAITNILIHLE